MGSTTRRAAVVGGTTLLGRELLNELNQSAAVAWDLQLLEEGDEAEGQLTSAGDEAWVVHSLNEEAFAGLDLVFFAGEPGVTLQYLKPALAAGAGVVDLTGVTGQEPGFALRSPWVTRSQRLDLTTLGVAVPHPATLMLALVAERLEAQFGPADLVATALEPASQAGSAGVDELHQQTVGLLSFQEVPKAIFDAQIAFNVQGALGEETKVDLAKTRARIRQETGRLLGAASGMKLSLTLLQAPVFHGYVISAHVRFNVDADGEAVQSALESEHLATSADMVPSNRAATESGKLLVGVETEPHDRRSAWLVLAGDNLGLPARNAVEAAMELAALRPAPRVQ